MLQNISCLISSHALKVSTTIVHVVPSMKKEKTDVGKDADQNGY